MSSLWVAGRRVAIGSLRRGGIFVLAPLLVLYEVILDRKSLLVFDAQEYFVPKYLEVARQWRQGILPVWDPTVFSGSPLLGGGQAGVFYPPNLLYIFCPTLVVYQALLIGHMVLGGIGARLLARRLVGSEWGASISGAAPGHHAS